LTSRLGGNSFRFGGTARTNARVGLARCCLRQERVEVDVGSWRVGRGGRGGRIHGERRCSRQRWRERRTGRECFGGSTELGRGWCRFAWRRRGHDGHVGRGRDGRWG
jgi:hypothetical protein